MARRKAYLHKNGLDGTDGSIYSKTKGLAQMVASLKGYLRTMDDLEMGTSVKLYTIVNESRKEHSFAKHQQSGQSCHPTMQKYSKTKSGDKEVIKKLRGVLSHTTLTNSRHSRQDTSLICHPSP